MKRAGQKETWKSRRDPPPPMNLTPHLKYNPWMSDSADRRRERDCAGQPVARLRVAVGVWVRRVGVSHTSQEYCELISTLERGGVLEEGEVRKRRAAKQCAGG